MSVRLQLYLGPYVEVVCPVTTTRVDRCGHQPKAESRGFCATCGRALRERWGTKHRIEGDPNDLLDVDVLIIADGPREQDKQTFWLLSNRTADGYDLPSDDAYAIDTASREEDAEMAAFEDRYSEQLRRLPKGLWELCWGLVQWWL